MTRNQKRNKTFKKLLLSSALIALPSIASIATVSCVKWDHNFSKPLAKFGYEDYTTKEALDTIDYSTVGRLFDQELEIEKLDPNTLEVKKVTLTYWDYFSAIEGKVVGISDGDTISVEVTKGSLDETMKIETGKPPKVIKVRLPLIDTLEEHTPNKEVPKEERALALIDHMYVENELLPIGTKVRLITNSWSEMTYDRNVAEIFFGDKFSKCYSVELVGAGYSLARLGDSQINAFKGYYTKAKKLKWEAFVLPYLAYAINDAIEMKRGFYDAKTFEKEQYKDNKEIYDHLIKGPFKNAYAFSKMYKSHGEMVSFSEFILSAKNSKIRKNHRNSIFMFMKKVNG